MEDSDRPSPLDIDRLPFDPVRSANHDVVKDLLLLFALFLSFGVCEAQWLSGYSYRKTIEVNSTYVDEELSDFPLYLKLVNTDFVNPENCQPLKTASAFDLIFTNSIGTVLDHEIRSFDPASGEYDVWVNVLTVSPSSNTEVYMYYGKRDATDPSTPDTWQQTAGMWHFEASGQDGSSGNNNLVLESGISTVPGIIGNAFEFDGTSQNASQSYNADFDFGTSDFSVAGWIKAEPKPAAIPVGLARVIAGVADSAEEPLNGGPIDHDGTVVEIGRDPDSGVRDYILLGMKFSNVDIPEGAVISDAYLEFTVDELSSSLAKFEIYVEDALDPADFNDLTNKPSDRALFSTSAEWVPESWNTIDELHRTTSIKNLIQNQVNKTSWDGSSKDIVILIDGFGERRAKDEVNLVVDFETTGSSVLEIQVQSTADDVEEALAGTMSAASNLNIENDQNNWVGMRFQNVPIPKGATVTAATIEFESGGNSGSTLVDVEIYAEDVAHSEPFALTDYELTNRTKTSPVSWSNIGQWTSGSKYETPDIKTLIEEIIQKDGWSSGNALSIFLKPLDPYLRSAKTAPAVPAKLQLTFSFDQSEPQSIVGRHDDGGFNIWINESGLLSFGIDKSGDWDQNNSTTSTDIVNEGSWKHFAAVKESNDDISIYVDGELESTTGLEEIVEVKVVSSGDDDIEERVSTGAILRTHGFLQIGTDVDAVDDQHVGFVFQNVNIPQGATIVSAYLQVMSGSEANSNSCNVTVKGHKGGSFTVNCTPSCTASQISNGANTTAAISWSIPAFDGSPTAFDSPELKDLVGEIVSDAGWGSGGSMGLFLMSTGDIGERVIPSYDNAPGAGAALFVKYRLTDFGSISGLGNPDLHVGDFNGVDTTNFKGAIDELQILNKALTAAEIKARYLNVVQEDFYSVGVTTDQMTWNGSVDDDWSNPSNWTPNLAPWDDIDVLIPNVATVPKPSLGAKIGHLVADPGVVIDLTSSRLDVDCSCVVDVVTGGTVTVHEDVSIALPAGSGASEIVIDDIDILDGKNLTLQNDLRIDQSLSLGSTGHIITNGNTLTFAQNFFSDSYDEINDRNRTVVLDNGGVLRVEGVPDNSTAVFNVSLDETESTFSRVELINRNGVSVYFDLTFCDDLYTDGTCDGGSGGTLISQNSIGRTWNITSDVSVGANVDGKFYWHSDMELSRFDENAAVIYHHNGTRWEELVTLTSSDDISLDYASNVFAADAKMTSFSPFGVGEGNQPLPVTLTRFAGKQIRESILLEWETETELNNDYFVLEKSEDGINFERIGTLEGSGTSSTRQSYSFEDSAPTSGRQFYRLTQVDFDLSQDDLGVIMVDFQSLSEHCRMYPNPTSSHVFIGNLPMGIFEMEIMSLDGRIVTSDVIESKVRLGEVLVDLKELPAGTYIARVRSSVGIMCEKKLIKQD